MSNTGTNPASLKGKLMSLEVCNIKIGNDKICLRWNEFS